MVEEVRRECFNLLDEAIILDDTTGTGLTSLNAAFDTKANELLEKYGTFCSRCDAKLLRILEKEGLSRTTGEFREKICGAKYVEILIGTLITLAEALNSLDEEYKVFMENYDSKDSRDVPPMPFDCLSIKEQGVLQTVAKFLSVLGFHSLLMPGVGLQFNQKFKTRSESDSITCFLQRLREDPSLNLHQRNAILTENLVTAKAFLTHPNMIVNMSQKLGLDIQAAIVQVLYSPRNSAEISAKEVVAKVMSYFYESFFLTEIVRNYFLLLSLCSRQFKQGRVLPGYFEVGFRSELGKLFLRPRGVETIANAFLNIEGVGEDDPSFASSEDRKCVALCELTLGLLLRKPKVDVNKIFQVFCPQLTRLLDFSGDRLSQNRYVAFFLNCVDWITKSGKPQLFDAMLNFLLYPIFQPLLCVCYKSTSDEALKTNEDKSDEVEIFHSSYETVAEYDASKSRKDEIGLLLDRLQKLLAVSGMSENLPRLLVPIFSSLFRLHEFSNGSASWFSTRVRSILVSILQRLNADVSCSLILAVLTDATVRLNLGDLGHLMSYPMNRRISFAPDGDGFSACVAKESDQLTFEDEKDFQNDLIMDLIFESVKSDNLVSALVLYGLKEAFTSFGKNSTSEVRPDDSKLLMKLVEFKFVHSLLANPETFVALSKNRDDSLAMLLILDDEFWQKRSEVLGHLEVLASKHSDPSIRHLAAGNVTAIKTRSAGDLEMLVEQLVASMSDELNPEIATESTKMSPGRHFGASAFENHLKAIDIENKSNTMSEAKENVEASKAREGHLLNTECSASDVTESLKRIYLSSSDVVENQVLREDFGEYDHLKTFGVKSEAARDVLTLIADREPAIRGAGLMKLSKLLDSKDAEILSNISALRRLLEDNLAHEDSYVYEMATRAVVAMAAASPADALGLLGKQFANVEDKLMNFETRLKIGEAITRCVRRLGELAYHHRNYVLHPALACVRDPEPEIRASAASCLAELMQGAGKLMKNEVPVILRTAENLVNDPAEIVRRAAVHLVHKTISGVGKDYLTAHSRELLPVWRSLKRIYTSSDDKALAMHAELAMLEINNIVKDCLRSAVGRQAGNLRIVGLPPL
ncbi:unnamed protein product [Notodromas monacha]|uniref:Uncharacterized protein n=1 Tax=Notodromas monacha TaxID=399045 RepID=A0A7R9GC91_9CRUS|nr:unnamed protein product [Notodromas monacha]CAG0917239.1 unnamed protein product [Notodromas monacha]